MAWFKRPLQFFLSLSDVQSIRFRLTAGVVLVATLGIGGMAGWMGWRLQRDLLLSHRQAVSALSQRFREDVALYQDMMSTQAAIQKVIDLRALGDTAIWVRSPEGQLLVQSETLSMGSWQAAGLTDYLQTLSPDQQLTIQRVGDRQLALCISPLTVAGNSLGTLFVAQDITHAYRTYVAMMRHLILLSLVIVGGLALFIAFYVQRSLHPLRVLGHQVEGVTAASLNDTRLQLDRAPTEVRALAAALDHTLARLGMAWEQQRRLVGDVSHELRTPLTLVQGYLQSTLRRCQGLTEPQRDGLETAAAETDRTIRILNDLLILARASMGHLSLHQERVDLKAVVLETIASLDVAATRVTVAIETAPLWVRADASALRQVLIHLLDNALNYSAPDQSVSLRLTRQQDVAVLAICDRGRGIPLADQAAIFEPFYRVDVDRSRATGGTGLGLAIVKTLVETMQGSISVQSKLGEGSTFTVRLPICQGV